MKHILFVDDEAKVLDGLRRSLRSMRAQWSISVCSSGAEALARLEAGGIDVVISDMRMPGMDGAQLLQEVRRRYPHIVRIVLSGQSDQETLLRSVGQTHLYLSKPCDPEELRTVIARACALRDRLTNEAVLSFVLGLPGLPSLPVLYKELQQATERNASLDEIGSIISSDLGMASRILQLVNSAFFNLRRTINSPVQAVTFLGLDTVRSLVLGLHAFSALALKPVPFFSAERLWAHSMKVAHCAREIAKQQRVSQLTIDACFSGGLLHDIGMLMFMTHQPDAYGGLLNQTASSGEPLHEHERRLFGATHADVGACLLGMWGLTDTIVEAVAYHHEPSAGNVSKFGPLGAIHVADVIVDGQDGVAAGKSRFDAEYVDAIGITQHLDKWMIQETMKYDGGET